MVIRFIALRGLVSSEPAEACPELGAKKSDIDDLLSLLTN